MDPSSLVIQSGFAGLSVVLLGVLSWMGKAFIAEMRDSRSAIIELAKQSNGSVDENTDAVRALSESAQRQTDAFSKLHEEMLRRPCLVPKQRAAAG